MMMILAWILVALGVGHCLYGLVLFRKPLAAALGEGFIGKFATPERRGAFWFMAFGLLLLMGGHVAVLAVSSGNIVLLRIIGLYLFAVSVIGVAALPKSPFAVVVFIAAFIVAGSMGWVG
jgi:hypothetical protein